MNLRVLDASRLGDGCGVLRLGSAGVKWGPRARNRGGNFGGDCLQVGVDRVAGLCDERGGGVDRGFGTVPFQVEVCVTSCFIRCVQ